MGSSSSTVRRARFLWTHDGAPRVSERVSKDRREFGSTCLRLPLVLQLQSKLAAYPYTRSPTNQPPYPLCAVHNPATLPTPRRSTQISSADSTQQPHSALARCAARGRT